MGARTKFIVFLLMFMCPKIQYAQMLDVTVTLPNQNITTGEIIKTLNNQHNLEFSYIEGLINSNELHSLPKLSIKLRDLLNDVFETEVISWKLRNNLVIITRKDNNRVISGYIKDASSSEAISNAHVFDEKSLKGSYSNSYGFFSINIPDDNKNLIVSHLGYRTKHVKIEEESTITIYLQPNAQELNEVILTPKSKALDAINMSTVNIGIKEINQTPQIFGEPDVLKTLSILPGVRSGVEGSSGVYVRGGGNGGNLILLDDVPVYNANHLFGFFSVFNPNAIQDVKLVKGGFPANYGGRLSSVIDIKMKEGNRNKLQYEGSLGLIASNLTIQGPIKKEKSSFLFSARRTYLDLFTTSIAKLANSNRTIGYNYWDLNGKLSHSFSDKDRIYLSMYLGGDLYNDKYKTDFGISNGSERVNEESGLNWGNVTTSFRWNHVYNSKLFSNLVLYRSKYKFGLEAKIDNVISNERVFRKNDYKSNIEDLAAKIDFDYFYSNKHKFKFGAAFIHHTFLPGAFTYNSNLTENISFGSSEVATTEYYGYLLDRFNVSKELSLNLGVHLAGSSSSDKSYFSIQPRIAGRFNLNNSSSLRFSFAQMEQYIHLLVNSGVGLPTDLWVPSNKEIKPQKSQQLALGFTKKIKPDLIMSVETYYKWMKNLIEYKDGVSFVNIDNNWESLVESGKGKSYGAEFLLKKTTGVITGQLAYTYARSLRKFDNLNFGKEFPFKYDRKHDVNLLLVHNFKSNKTLSLAWNYGTGYPITLPTSTFINDTGHFTGTNQEDFVYNYPARNSSRIKDYHRLDLSMTFSKKKKWGTREWNIGLYNVYSRLNPTFIDFDDENVNDKRFKQLSLFPIIPSISYKFISN